MNFLEGVWEEVVLGQGLGRCIITLCEYARQKKDEWSSQHGDGAQSQNRAVEVNPEGKGSKIETWGDVYAVFGGSSSRSKQIVRIVRGVRHIVLNP